MNVNDTENECFLCLDSEKESGLFITLNCCKTHQIHKSCLYNALLYYFSDINMKTMPCPICRKLIILKDYFTYDECNKYFSLMPDEYQKRFIIKHTFLLKYNFIHTLIDINEESRVQSKNVECKDFTFLFVLLFVFLTIIVSSIFI
jgi:hypothetical protein